MISTQDALSEISQITGKEAQALAAALGDKIGIVPSPDKIADPAPVREVLKYVRKTAPRLLLTAPFSLPAAGRKAQTSDALLRSAPCQTFATLYGSKAPGDIKRLLLIVSGGEHNRAALRLVEVLRKRLGATDTAEAESMSDFPEALEALSTAFAQTPGIRMETVSFRSGVLDLQLTAPDVEALDKLRQLISDAGQFTAEIQSANPADEVIKGRVQIKAAEAS